MQLSMMWKLFFKTPPALARLHIMIVMAIALLQSGGALAQTNNRYQTFRFGVCYYPEQWPESCWEDDARRMQECGVNTVRMGEFGWALMEPREGHYDFSSVSYTHLRAHETGRNLVCRLLLEKK